MFKGMKICALLVAVLMLFSMLLTGCGNSSSGQKTDAEKTAETSTAPADTAKQESNSEPVELRFAVLDDSGMKLEVQAFADGFKAENPNVTVKTEPLAGNYEDKVLVQASAGTLPDVFWLSDIQVGRFASKGVPALLDDYFTKFGVDKADFYESMLKLGQYQGKQYMIPRDYNHVVCQYNKDLFTAAGVPFPKNGWTWQEFIDTARKLVKKEGGQISQYGCLGQINWQATILPMMYGLGGSLINDAGDGANFNTEGTVKALKEIKGLVDEGVFVNQLVKGAPGFDSKKVAMHFHVRPSTAGNEKALGNGKWDVVTFPIMPVKHVIGSGCSGYSVYSKSKNVDMAAKLLFYIIGEKGQEVFMKTGNSIPVRKSLANSDVWRSLPTKDHNQDAYVLYSDKDIIPTDCTLKDTSLAAKFDEIWQKALEKIFLNQSSVEDAVKAGHDDLVKLFGK